MRSRRVVIAGLSALLAGVGVAAWLGVFAPRPGPRPDQAPPEVAAERRAPSDPRPQARQAVAKKAQAGEDEWERLPARGAELSPVPGLEEVD